MKIQKNIDFRFNLIAQDRDGSLTIEIMDSSKIYLLRQKPQEVLSNPILIAGFPPKQVEIIKSIARDFK